MRKMTHGVSSILFERQQACVCVWYNTTLSSLSFTHSAHTYRIEYKFLYRKIQSSPFTELHHILGVCTNAKKKKIDITNNLNSKQLEWERKINFTQRKKYRKKKTGPKYSGEEEAVDVRLEGDEKVFCLENDRAPFLLAYR